MALETIQERTVFNGDRNGVPCCRRAAAERVPVSTISLLWYDASPNQIIFTFHTPETHNSTLFNYQAEQRLTSVLQ